MAKDMLIEFEFFGVYIHKLISKKFKCSTFYFDNSLNVDYIHIAILK